MGFADKILGIFSRRENGRFKDKKFKKKGPKKKKDQPPLWMCDKMPSASLDDDIRDVLKTHFSQYMVNENVPVKDIDKKQKFGGPVDFALYQKGKIVAVIMLIRETKRTKRYWGVELACKAKGIKLMNFYYLQWFTPEGAVKYMSKFIDNNSKMLDTWRVG